jgi:hypothetical protein
MCIVGAKENSGGGGFGGNGAFGGGGGIGGNGAFGGDGGFGGFGGFGGGKKSIQKHIYTLLAKRDSYFFLQNK